MTSMMIKTDTTYNPLDLAELVIMDRDWVFDRPADGELIAEVNGAWCNYRIWFSWAEDSGGLALTCAMDGKFPKSTLPKIHSLLAMINEKIWLGHFSVNTEDASVTFRHAVLIRDGVGTSAEHLQDLLDIALSLCERF